MNVKEHILKVAEELFFEKGYHTTSIRDIGSRASVNSSMINYYFQSKENLYLSIFHNLKFRVDQICKSEAEVQSYEEAYQSFLSKTIKLYTAAPSSLKLFLSEQIHPTTKAIQQIVQEIEEIHFKYFITIFELTPNPKGNNNYEFLIWKYYSVFSVLRDVFAVHYRNKTVIKKTDWKSIVHFIECSLKK